MNKQKQKEPLSLMIAKTVLAIAVFTGLGTIIIGGGVVIMKYYNSEVNNRIIEPVDQEENYYDVLEKKCDNDSCCLSSLKIIRENNYKEADKDYKCLDGFKLGGLRCVGSLIWCEPIKECVDEQNNRRKIGEIWLEDSTMFMECNEFGSVSSNYILSCGNEKLIISNSLSFDENSIYRNTPSAPFLIGTDGSLKYTWIIDGNKYTEFSGGPTGVFASCENKKVTTFHFGGMGEAYYNKTFFDGNFKTTINCLDWYQEEIYNEDDPKNFTISKVKGGERVGESKPLENGKEICQEVKERYQELKEIIIDTSGWQTYRNEEFGFEIKHPDEWKQCEGENICFRKDISFDHPRSFIEINIKANQNNQNLSLDRIVYDFENNGYVYGQKEYIAIDNKKAFKAEITNWGMIAGRQLLIIGENYWYDIVISGTDIEDIETYQIFSTFKFIEK